MNLLHICCNYIGTKLYRNLIHSLSNNGVTNTVYVPTYLHERLEQCFEGELIVDNCFNKWDRLIYSYKQSKIFKSLDNKVNIRNFDLIHAHTTFTDGNIALNLKKKYNIPYVVTVRNTDMNVFFKYMFHLRKKGNEILDAAEAIFFLSGSYRDKLINLYIEQNRKDRIKRKSFVIPNGIDDFWHNNCYKKIKTLDKKELKLLFVGRIDSNKNISAIQEAMEYLCQMGVSSTLTVVGPICDEKEFKKLSKKPFKYIPPVNFEELLSIYREHDIFVMTSFTETFGLVYAEAMSQGLPVVYTKGEGFDGQFKDGYLGFSVLPKDYPGIAQAIIKITKNYSEMSRNATLGVKSFLWSDISSKYFTIYKQSL